MVVCSVSVSVLEALPERDCLLDLRVLLAGGSDSDSGSTSGWDSGSGSVFDLEALPVRLCLFLAGWRPLLGRGSASASCSDSGSTLSSAFSSSGSVIALEVGRPCLPDVRLFAGGSGSDSGSPSTSSSGSGSGSASAPPYIGFKDVNV